MLRATKPFAVALVAAGLLGAVCANAQTRTAEATESAKAQEASAALARGNPKSAVELFTEALKDQTLSNDRRAVMLTDRAVAYARLGQSRPALEDFNRAAQIFPEYAAIYNNRGSLLLTLNQPREAIKDFDRAVLLTPGYALAYHNRAAAYARLGQIAEAIADYTKAIELMPAAPAPLAGRGRVYLNEARPFAAIRDFSRAIQGDARSAIAYRSRAEAKLQVERSEDAIEDLSRAIAFDARNPELFILRGEAYVVGRNPNSAIKDFSRAIELDPRSVAAYQGRGLAHARAETFEEAEADLAKAIELDPRAATAFAYRGYVYKLTAQPELGAREVEKAMKLDPNRAVVHWSKGEVDEALGKIDEAVAAFRRALALKAGYKDAIEGLERLGAAPQDNSGDAEVAGAGTGRWRVVTRAGRYFAVTDEFPRVRVPLEMMAAGMPKLIEWELRKAPTQGIGTLKFASGSSGAGEVEQVAIVDVQTSSVVGVLPDRIGERRSQWTWEEGRLSVASADGVTDEFTLRSAKPKEVPVAAAPQPKRVSSGGNEGSAKGTPSWAPWAQSGWAESGSGGGSQRQQRQQAKPKTLFDIILGK